MLNKIVLVLAIVLFNISAVSAEPEKEKQKEPNTYELLNLFGEVMERAKLSYVEEISDKKLIESAINGMLTSLDPHSSYLDADSFTYMTEQTKGKFGGLGIEVTMDNGLVKVVSPIDDTPAHKAGIKAGDYITHIDGETVIGLNLNEAVSKMRGKIGTNVKLSIRRANEKPFDVTIKRQEIKIQSVKTEIKNDDIFVAGSRRYCRFGIALLRCGISDQRRSEYRFETESFGADDRFDAGCIWNQFPGTGGECGCHVERQRRYQYR